MNRTKKILFALLAAAAGTVIILAVFLFRHQNVNMEQVYEVLFTGPRKISFH